MLFTYVFKWIYVFRMEEGPGKMKRDESTSNTWHVWHQADAEKNKKEEPLRDVCQSINLL